MNDTNIIGVSGKKQSGKDTLCSYLQAWFSFNFSRKDCTGGDSRYLQDYDCKIYSFADPLKKFCIDVMGLTYEQCYGSEEEKNSYTKYKWDNLPLNIRIKYSKKKKKITELVGTVEPKEFGGETHSCRKVTKGYKTVPRTGFMTAREILQYVGSDIFREQFSDTIWADATINLIKKENKKIALVSDTRFISEIDATMNEKNGYIIRLKRKISNDKHVSETQLDNYNFSKLGDKCLVIDNRNMTIEEQCKIGLEFFQKIINRK